MTSAAQVSFGNFSMSCVGSRPGALRKKSLPRSWDALRGSAWDAVVKLLPFVQIISLNKDPKTQDSERISLGLSSSVGR